jgi:hypothetical protein
MRYGQAILYVRKHERLLETEAALGDPVATRIREAYARVGCANDDQGAWDRLVLACEEHEQSAPKEGDLRVWWATNPPRQPFTVSVKGADEAKRILQLLTAYDLYLGDLIQVNAGGLEVFRDGDWTEYEDEDGQDIWQIIDQEGDQVDHG